MDTCLAKDDMNSKLFGAIKRGNCDELDNLLSLIPASELDVCMSSTLIWAVNYENHDAAISLPDCGAEPVGMCGTALTVAVLYENFDIVNLLLGRGVNIEAADQQRGMTALMWASYLGYDQIVALLLDRGASAHTVNNNGYSSAQLANLKGYPHIVTLIKDEVINRECNVGGLTKSAATRYTQLQNVI